MAITQRGERGVVRGRWFLAMRARTSRQLRGSANIDRSKTLSWTSSATRRPVSARMVKSDLCQTRLVSCRRVSSWDSVRHLIVCCGFSEGSIFGPFQKSDGWLIRIARRVALKRRGCRGKSDVYFWTKLPVVLGRASPSVRRAPRVSSPGGGVGGGGGGER